MSLKFHSRKIAVAHFSRFLLAMLVLGWFAGPIFADITIGNKAWLDTNGDGTQDGGEAAAGSVVVKIYLAADDSLQGTTTTDGAGAYSFTVADGTYYLVFTAPNGMTFCAKDQGGDDTADSDVNPDGTTGTVNATTNDLDCGLIEPTSVGDFVFNDLNGDGLQDDGEAGVANVTVQLWYTDDATIGDADDALVATTSTDGDGAYSFGSLVASQDYYLKLILPAGYAVSPMDEGADDDLDSDFDPDPAKLYTDIFSVAYSEEVTNVDAGIYKTIKFRGRVWDDEDGDGVRETGEGNIGANATVKLYDAGADEEIGGGDDVEEESVNTTSTYSFAGVGPGVYYVKITAPAGWDFVRENQGDDNDFDSDVDESTGASQVFSVTSGHADVVIDAGLNAFGSVNGLVWYDGNSDGIQDGAASGPEDVAVGLYTAGDDDEIGTDDDEFVKGTTTADDGTYTITKVPAGDYYVLFSPPTGYTFSPQDQGDDDTADSDADEDGLTAEFTVVASTAKNNIDCGLRVDSDGDGTADDEDGCPYDADKTAPGDCGCGHLDTDTDEDGVADCDDNCLDTANDSQRDFDGDGVGDACDNCPSVANADQKDANHNGIGDACETDDDEIPQAEPPDDNSEDPNDSGAPSDGNGTPDDGSDETPTGLLPILFPFCGFFGWTGYLTMLAGYTTFVAWRRRR